MDGRPLVLVGASGLAVEVAECVRRQGRAVRGCFDDDPALAGTSLPGGVRVLGTTDSLATHEAVSNGELGALVLCIGHGSDRRRVVGRLAAMGFGPERFTTVLDPSVVLPVGCHVGPGSVLLAGVVVTAPISIGAHVVVMPHVTLTHDDVVGDYVTLAAGVSLGGGVRVESEAYVGMNASVHPHRTVGARSTLGMGAALIHDLPAGETWAGVPARLLSEGLASGTGG
jgi:sugar O-acyltransferase (sialic acid O-acetyltransferase NeuD family)